MAAQTNGGPGEPNDRDSHHKDNARRGEPNVNAEKKHGSEKKDCRCGKAGDCEIFQCHRVKPLTSRVTGELKRVRVDPFVMLIF